MISGCAHCPQLGTDTWFYAKRAFLALADTLAKHMIMLKDAVSAARLRDPRHASLPR